MKTLAIAHAAAESDDFQKVAKKLSETLFPYEKKKKQDQLQRAQELLEQEQGRELHIKEADY